MYLFKACLHSYVRTWHKVLGKGLARGEAVHQEDGPGPRGVKPGSLETGKVEWDLDWTRNWLVSGVEKEVDVVQIVADLVLHWQGLAADDRHQDQGREVE